MTSIHARIPANLRQAVDAARERGEEDQPSAPAGKEAPVIAKMKSRPAAILLRQSLPFDHLRTWPLPLARNSEAMADADADANAELSDDDEDHEDSKENDPSQSPSPVIQSPRSPRKNALGKRPLSELPIPSDPEDEMTESERNIAVNQTNQVARTDSSDRPKKSPKLTMTSAAANIFTGLEKEVVDEAHMTDSFARPMTSRADDEKENLELEGGRSLSELTKMPIREASASGTATVRPTLRKVSNMSSSKGRQQPRVGIRRL
jgi:ubiquitin-conjugating enzyme E2 S